MKNAFYIIYNFLYQLVSFFFLFIYANTFVNEALVPESLMWKDNKPRTDWAGLGTIAIIKTTALLTEATILIFIIYFINKLFLNYSHEKNNTNKILSWTIKTNIILSLCFITVLIWGSFRGFLW